MQLKKIGVQNEEKLTKENVRYVNAIEVVYGLFIDFSFNIDISGWHV